MQHEQPLSIVWTWLDWWRIDHYAIRRINRVWTPALGVVASVVVSLAPADLNLFGNLGVVNQTNGLIPMLAGFFVASLAAVATFNRSQLDDIMGGAAPRLPIRGQEAERLTRRRFLCILFGYLAGASIALYLVGGVIMIGADELHRSGVVSAVYRLCARAMFTAVYLGMLANLILTAFLGLHFLIERIHQKQPLTGFLDVKPPD